MFVLSFRHYAGADKVFKSTTNNLHPGDLLQSGDDFIIPLGDDIAFGELYTYSRDITNYTLHTKGFISSSTLSHIHRLVQNYYTSYKNALALFVGSDVPGLLSKQVTTKKKPKYSPRTFNEQTQQFNASSEQIPGQQLIVFPDLRTLSNTIPQQLQETASIRHSQLSPGQQAKIFRQCKMGHISTLCTTHAGIFQDWQNLQAITLLDPYKRYYQNYQDPRYKVREVLENMAGLYKIQFSLVHDF